MSTTALNAGVVGYGRRSVRGIMGHVMLALVPGTIVYATLIDYRIILNVLVAIIAALCVEAVLLRLRQRAILPLLCDGSIVLAAWLLALCVPPSLPAWQLIAGIVVMTGLGKHLYGGLGQNPFNPAMVAYAVLIVSFPVTMTDWQINVNGSEAAYDNAPTQLPQLPEWDAITGATPLDRLRQARSIIHRRTAPEAPTQPGQLASEPDTRKAPGHATTPLAEGSPLHALRKDMPEGPAAIPITNPMAEYSRFADAAIMRSPWKWVSLAWLAGGIYLLFAGIITWHIPASVLLTVAVLYLACGSVGTVPTIPLIPALLSGALMIGAFFIATDPVSAATSNTGKLIYGAGIGVFTFVIREYSVYPEGVAFAVLLMNICVPLLDYLFTRAVPTSDAGRK
ncbi:MAG: RnfABCDGE type electron transport complex subunit D [Granulosicoccus sp.]|nr:RnfABCDGE type electron transport complex subunit D [Granulosicoccus sp.]